MLGWIGTGVMGRWMCGHLMDAGHPVVVYNRTRAKAQPLLDAGAQWRDTPAAVAAAADVVFTMVGFPADVEAVYFGETGIMQTLSAGKTVVDMTTTRPSLAQRIAVSCQAIGAHALDETARLGLSLPGLQLAHRLYLDVQAAGEGACGTQALIHAIERCSAGA